MQCVTCQNEQEPGEEICPDCNGSGYNERSAWKKKGPINKLNIDVSSVELKALMRIADTWSFDHSEDAGELDARNIVEAMCVRIIETAEWSNAND